MSADRLGLFEAYGVELEYMIVRCDTLDVYPVTDEVLREIAGEYVSDVEVDGIGWSNELVLHVIEFKTPIPARRLDGLAARFQESVRRANQILAPRGGRLMPSAMHPWMNPHRDMRLWPHEYSPIYEAYNRIFCCQGHGWANLQSVHLNLPFASDEEFGKLHAAIRVLLPILPALSASSPIVEMAVTGFLDTRMEVYRHNQDSIPSLAGHIIPERVYTEADYGQQVFQRLYRDIAPHDPDEILRDEFLNSRGAIARFGRGSIEIRVLDIQECPAADLAVLSLVAETLKALTFEKWSNMQAMREWHEEKLKEIFLGTIRDAEHTMLLEPEYLELFGVPAGRAMTAGELWHHIEEELFGAAENDEFAVARRFILEKGTLARRILRAVGTDAAPERVRAVYGQLCECLSEGRMFRG